MLENSGDRFLNRYFSTHRFNCEETIKKVFNNEIMKKLKEFEYLA